MPPRPPQPVLPANAPSEDSSSAFWSKWRIGVAGSAALMLLGVVIWYATRPPSQTPLQNQYSAFELLEPENDTPANRRLARKLALELQEIKFHDPDFPGAAEYILGILAFRDGLEIEEGKREERFLAAVQYLRDAERLALNSEYRPEWAYVLGSSLHALSLPVEARPYIEEALTSTPERQQELTAKLIEIYLELKTPAMLAKALTLAENHLQTVKEQKADEEQVNLATLRRAQVLVALQRTEEALASLPKLDPNHEVHLGMQIIQAQTFMGFDTRAGYQKAREILQRLLSSSGLTDSEARQTHYLLGVCEELLGDSDRAINQYERTKSRYPKSHEGVSAALKQARLLQEAGRDEEALSAYELALKSVTDPQTYNNRWTSIEQFRSLTLRAWNSWVEDNEYTNAIALSKLMPPLFSQIQASELEARAFEKWAESYERQNAHLKIKDPKTYKRDSRERWSASGDAYASLAELLKTSPKYSEVLWKSAEHYANGYRFRNAQEQLKKFIATGPKERQPLAAVELAYTQINEDKTEAALQLLERTIRENPKDPASFRAAYLMGIASIERQNYDEARTIWRDVLESSYLGPAAKEWRDSLLALGATLYHLTSARIALNNTLEKKLTGPPAAVENPQSTTESNLEDWDEAIAKLHEYVRRYPDSPQHLESMYLLARAYQKSANEYHAKLESAQIANEKQELAEEYQQRLRTSAATLRELKTRLLREEEDKTLDEFLSRLLQNTYFDLGDIEFALHEYDRALLVYGSAINRYPDHVRVLLCYLQMAQCYQQLNKIEEARSTLKQAQILVQRMDDAAFASKSTSLKDRQQWNDWFEWTLNMMPTNP